MRKILDPSVEILIVLGVGFQIAFTKSVYMNLIVIVVGLIYVLVHRQKLNYLLIAILVSLPLAIGTAWSFLAFSTGDNVHNALIYSIRLYAYLVLGCMLTLTNTVPDILFSTQQNLKIPSTFIYGFLAVFNLFYRLKNEFKKIRYAARLKGQNYYVWSPKLYFKCIVVALSWSNDIAEAMTSNGFTEGAPRTRIRAYKIPIIQWLIGLILIISYGYGAFGIRPW
ncbi:energy-coupling factor transporter transmembrane component T family protein [Pediococcus claussenii]|uniref:Cobalt transport family protein n=1 Tax=Pediococcus claussenii (strain ATCC BAA-344 / DSM 14800 / JCM 18046 / KCTC 3811 / LMG 21948 / P06) TaxID=701521 RepID=G8PAI5_PEDCP|nr:energy-coupling factor transporter transmembrane component T [Pediococcus claussenii]AEV95774.1 cobalt transport family protein [Pediococcus claussenii ATCC BAA-344]ANZ70507.1 ABC transporter permease [Pediococcus claussenii]ANZ71098.1 ABC transporter permease [Pediococcus claussenii]KRN20384.1 hypothetical protein IV79_GL000437 [Pediococcus claussenii]